MAFDFEIKLTAITGFRFFINYTANGAVTSQKGAQTTYTIPANQEFVMTIARSKEQEDASETADFNVFSSAVIVTSAFDGNILRKTSQTLTDTEKTTARTNIGAMGSAELQTEADNREEKDNELKKNIIVVENALGIKSVSLFDSSDFVNGYVKADGDIAYSSNYIVTKNKIYIPSGSVIQFRTSGQYYTITEYHSDDSVTVGTTITSKKCKRFTENEYIRVHCRKLSSDSIQPSELNVSATIEHKIISAVENLSNNVSGFNSFSPVISLGEFEKGSIGTNGVNANDNLKIRTKGYIDISTYDSITFEINNGSKIANTKGFRYVVLWFNENFEPLTAHSDHGTWQNRDKTYALTNEKYIRVILSYSDSTVETNISDSWNLVLKYRTNLLDLLNFEQVNFYYDTTDHYFELGTLDVNGNSVAANPPRLRSKFYYRLEEGSILYISIATGFRYFIQWFDESFNPIKDINGYGTYFDNGTGETQVYNYPNLKGARYFRIVFGYTNGNEISVSDCSNISLWYVPQLYAKNDSLNYNRFITPYKHEEWKLFRKVLLFKKKDTLTFTLSTDNHYERGIKGRNQLRIAKAITKIAEMVGADCNVNLGDLVMESINNISSTYTNVAEIANEFGNSYIPFIYAIAHHEMYPMIDSHTYTGDWSVIVGLTERYTRYLKDIHDNNDSGSSSYYIDFEKSKIRMISLDSVSNTQNGFSDSVVNFLANQALVNVPTGYSVIVIAHVSARHEVNVSANWVQNETAVCNALNSFVDNGGTVLAYLHGHVHWDNIYQFDSDKFPFISICCERCEEFDVASHSTGVKGTPTSYPRVPNTYSEYCFDTFNVDPTNKIIRMFRFGAGYDRILHCDTKNVSTSLSLTSELTGTLTWTSVETSVATVANGVVTAVAFGTTIIRATDESGANENWIVKVS